MTLIFKELIIKHKCTQRAYQALYYFSNKIKNIENYIAHKNEQIDIDIKKYEKFIYSNKPIERLTKSVFFCNIEFILLNQVFCPRHETEIIIQIIQKNKKILNGNYIDICSGTGVIGITTHLNNPNLNTTLLDISEQAIKNIKLNAKKHNINATIIKEDWFSHLIKNNKYEIITANFPYIGKKDNIDKNLTINEPSIALFADNNGWEHYEKLIKYLKINKYWKLVILECSSLHKQKWEKLTMKEIQWKIELFNDNYGLFRAISIKRHST